MSEVVAAVGAVPSLWQNRPFLRLWLAQVISNAGTSITNVALPLTAALILGATPAQMGLLGVAGALPYLLFGLLAGVWVDRTRRRPLLVGADLGRALLFGSIPVAAALGHLTLFHLWAVTFLAGTLTVFFQIASIAALPSLVTKSQLVEANSKLSLSDSVIGIAGPGAAGGLVQLLGAPRAIIADAVSYLLSALVLGRSGVAESRPAREHGKFWREIGEGVRELIATPLVRVTTLTSGLGTLAGAVQGAILILFLARGLGLPPAMIGLVLASGGGGSLLGAFGVGRVTRRLGVGPTMILGKVIWLLGGVLVPLAGLAGGTLPLLAVGRVCAGLGGTVYLVNQLSLRQALTPVRLMGRTTAARRFIQFGAAAVGAALGGFLGEALGLRATLVVGASVLGVELLVLALSPVRHVRE
jgi:MFS family permease